MQKTVTATIIIIIINQLQFDFIVLQKWNRLISKSRPSQQLALFHSRKNNLGTMQPSSLLPWRSHTEQGYQGGGKTNHTDTHLPYLVC